MENKIKIAQKLEKVQKSEKLNLEIEL